MKKSAKKNQVNMTLDDATADLLDRAVGELGAPRAAIALDILTQTLPIYLEIKRQYKADESARLRAALEIALGKSPAVEPQHPSMARPERRRGGR